MLKTVLRLVGSAGALPCTAFAQWEGTDSAERGAADPVALTIFSGALPSFGLPHIISPLHRDTESFFLSDRAASRQLEMATHRQLPCVYKDYKLAINDRLP
jgi:hypothetical protein